jgi:hypothetical protein
MKPGMGLIKVTIKNPFSFTVGDLFKDYPEYFDKKGKYILNGAAMGTVYFKDSKVIGVYPNGGTGCSEDENKKYGISDKDYQFRAEKNSKLFNDLYNKHSIEGVVVGLQVYLDDNNGQIITKNSKLTFSSGAVVQFNNADTWYSELKWDTSKKIEIRKFGVEFQGQIRRSDYNGKNIHMVSVSIIANGSDKEDKNERSMTS